MFSNNTTAQQSQKKEACKGELSLVNLPADLQLDILGRLSSSELAVIGKCCKQLYRCSSDPSKFRIWLLPKSLRASILKDGLTSTSLKLRSNYGHLTSQRA